ncbi:MAG TPA: ribose-5-phosphate isomerase RpiA [Armatimonadota bacterium]
MDAKEAAGRRAAEFVSEGMVVGLGTGSTALHAIRALGERVAKGLSIRGIPTSEASRRLATELGIPLVGLGDVPYIDVTIDGADEVDPHYSLIKGGGGALLREKLVASSSREMIVVADESKIVPCLGAFPLPVAIVPFGCETTLKRLSIHARGLALREAGGRPFVSDDGLYIVDMHTAPIHNPDGLHAALKGTLGVVETGLFIGLATKVVVGRSDGSAGVLEPG